MGLIRDNLLIERPHPFSYIGGVQRLYRVKNHGLSLVDSPMLHHYVFAWEAAVIRYKNEDLVDFNFDLTYETPLTDDVEVFYTDEEANEFIQRFFDWAETQ